MICLAILWLLVTIINGKMQEDNRYTESAQGIMRSRGYELVGQEYQECKTKYMIKDRVVIRGHESIPDGYMTIIRAKRIRHDGVVIYIVRYLKNEFEVSERYLSKLA